MNRTTLLKMLAHPVRREILRLLAERATYVQDLAENVSRPQSYVSQQLRILRGEGMVRADRVGQRAYYSLLPGWEGQLVRAHLALATVAPGRAEGCALGILGQGDAASAMGRVGAAARAAPCAMEEVVLYSSASDRGPAGVQGVLFSVLFRPRTQPEGAGDCRQRMAQAFRSQGCQIMVPCEGCASLHKGV